jgi:hypothetical protein
MYNFIRVEVGTAEFTSGKGTLLHDSVSTVSALRVSYPKNFGESISVIKIEFIKNSTTVDDTILGDGKEIQLWHKTSVPVGYASADRLFRGFITKKEISGPRVIITASDVFVKAMWAVGAVSPEPYEVSTSIKTIITALCAAAGLTESIDATAMSPTNVTQFYYNQQNIFERLSYLLNLVGWYAVYDSTTAQTIKFQPKSAGSLQTFDSTNIISRPSWDSESSNLVNDILLIGGSNNIVNKIATFTGNGVSFIYSNAFPLTPALPVNTPLENVSVIGTVHTWTVDQFTMVNSSTPGVIFTKGVVPNNGEVVTITYTYQTASSTATTSNAGSQSAYIKRSKVIQKRDTLNTTDLGTWATNLVADTFWGKPIEEVSFLAMDATVYPVLGSKADVTDPMTGVTLTYTSDNSIVYTIEHQWPHPGTKVVISTKPLKNPMQQTTVQDSVEKVQLELKKINPTSLLRKDASTPIGGSQDFSGFQSRNFMLENSAIAPTVLGTGGLYFDIAAGAGKGIVKVNSGTSGTPTWVAVGVGTVTGTGTTNTIAKFTGTTAVGNSHITDDGTNVVITLGAAGTLTITRA